MEDLVLFSLGGTVVVISTCVSVLAVALTIRGVNRINDPTPFDNGDKKEA